MPKPVSVYTPPLFTESSLDLSMRRAAPHLISLLIKARARFLAGRLLEYSVDACFYTAIGYSVSGLILWAFGRITPEVTKHLLIAAIAVLPAYSAVRLLWTRFGLLETARLIDHRLALREELSAAVEALDSQNSFSGIITQRADGIAGGLSISRAIPVRIPRKAVRALGVLMIAGASTLLPYGTAIFTNTSDEDMTRMAQQGYQLLEEAQRIHSQAQAIDDRKLQELGDEMAKTAREMTERFSSERQIQRDLKRLSQSFAALNSAELGRAEELAEAGRELEEAYSEKTMEQSLQGESKRLRPGGGADDRLNAAIHQAEDALNDGEAGGTRADTPSDSEILNTMQKLQDETADAQSRQDALARAQESLSQAMDALGIERPKAADDPQQPEQTDEDRQGYSDIGSSPSGQESESQPQTVIDQESQGGGTGTEGGHFDAKGQIKPRKESRGTDERLTGQRGKGTVTSTIVLGSGDANGITGDTPGPVQSFAFSQRTEEAAAEIDKVPAAYRQIIRQYFGRK